MHLEIISNDIWSLFWVRKSDFWITWFLVWFMFSTSFKKWTVLIIILGPKKACKWFKTELVERKLDILPKINIGSRSQFFLCARAVNVRTLRILVAYVVWKDDFHLMLSLSHVTRDSIRGGKWVGLGGLKPRSRIKYGSNSKHVKMGRVKYEPSQTQTRPVSPLFLFSPSLFPSPFPSPLSFPDLGKTSSQIGIFF